MATTAKLLAQARAQQRAGQLTAAEAGYRQVLESEPENIEALHRLGVALLEQGRLDEAVASLQRARQLQADSNEIAQDLNRALAGKENLAGRELDQQGRLDEAVACFRRALELSPDWAHTHSNLGFTLLKQNKLNEALASYRQVVAQNSSDADAHLNVAVVLSQQKRWAEAMESYGRALELNPRSPQAHYNLGLALEGQKKPTEAIAVFEQAVKLDPNHAAARNNLGILLAARGELDAALGHYQQSLQLAPLNGDVYNNAGLALLWANRLDESAGCYRRALDLNPNDPEAHFGYAMLLLLVGRFAEGWQEYEWRFRRRSVPSEAFAQPRWNGAPLPQGTLLVHTEQGLGDSLQFIRYVELLKPHVGRVIVECQAPLARLLGRCAGVDRVVVRGQARAGFDAHVPLMSLPGMFGTTAETIPARVPYLVPAAEATAHWRRELGQTSGLKVGIAWQGNRDNPTDAWRSIPLAAFAGLARVPGVSLYSLQFGAGQEQLNSAEAPRPITDLATQLGDFDDTAAIVRNLDLVIACDSSMAHLAGGLGVRVWLALANSSDWRWLRERSDTPWYPTMRLFRQERRGDWSEVFQQIERELVALAAAK